MEKENLDHILENRQNYMMDNNSMQQINVAGVCDEIVGGVQAEVVSGVAGEILGGKYDELHEEHDVRDDDELKYVEEVQQSEKQQQQQLQTLKNFGLDDDGTCKNHELAEKETSYNEFGNGGFVFGGDHHNLKQQQIHDLFNIGNGHDTNGHDTVNTAEHLGSLVSSGFEEKLNMMESELDGIKNEGDFSSTSNVTESVEGYVHQIDVEIESKLEHQEICDEEEPSSLATNTTNGTSSLSENVPPQAVVMTQANVFDNFIHTLDDKENSDPLTLDLDQGHSQLNPEAKEFVPNFGSNPASPTSPFASGMTLNEPVVSEIKETQMYFGQAPAAVPRHITGDDDFVAQSPRKGKCDNNIDGAIITLDEFEKEADKRPHELEPEAIEGFNHRDEVMTPDQAIQQLPLDDTDNQHAADSTDFQTSNFMDHGPETCVDLEIESDMQPTAVLSTVQDKDDVMKTSMYVASEDAIEDVLNSVQVIPTEIDSVNNSFIEESATESALNQLAGDKELLQVEEKEHVSHSPSTEEIQMNLQNTFNSSNKDIPQLPIDMDNASNMHESMYVEQENYVEVNEGENIPLLLENPFEQEMLKDPQEEQSKNIVQDEQHFEQEQQHNNLYDLQPHVLPEHSDNLHETQTPEEVQVLHEEKESFDEIQDSQEVQLLANKPDEQQSNLDEEKNQLYADQPLDSNDTTNRLIANNSFLECDLSNKEHQEEIDESLSPSKFTLKDSNTHVSESQNDDIPTDEQESNINNDVITPLYTSDEKHLLEETKEQLLFSVSGLEQQMSEMMLNKSDDDLSQAEEVAATVATATEAADMSENVITPVEAIAPDEQQKEEAVEQMLVDDSFNRHEQECLREYEEENQHEQQMNVEIENEFDLTNESIESPIKQQHQQEVETKPDLVHESIESLLQQQHQKELESEMAAVDEPVMEVRQAAPLFTNEETEIVNEIRTEEKQELPLCMAPETAPAELLEPPMAAKNETETVEILNEPACQATEVVKTETIKEPEIEETKEKEAETVNEEVVATPDIPADVLPITAVVAAAAVAASTAAITTQVASPESKNKSETTKKPLTKATTAATKPKVGSTTAAKKPAETTTKKAVGLAAKPRTVPTKPAATTTDKKPIAKTTTTSTTAAARKTQSATTVAASKVVAKTTTTTTTTRTATATSKTTTTSKPTTAPRTVHSSTTAARKPATTNGALAKPRPTTAPAKPTTLGLPATNGAPKMKPLSPRSTLTSQVRKTTPATGAAKSPVKSTTTNGVTKTASSTLASRTKTTTPTVSTTAGTASKTFTARPAPKFTSSSSTTTANTATRRSTTGVSTMTSTATTTSTLKASSTPLRKSTPTKPAAGKTPIKAPGGLKSKSPATKTDSPAAKPAPIRKPVDNTPATVINGLAETNKELNGIAEEQYQKLSSIQNGDILAVKLEQQQNGDSSIPMQTEKLEPRDEKIPMDLINA